MTDVAIGLEVHARLATGRRLLSSAPVRDGAAPNSAVDPWSVGEPGAMPVLDPAAVTLALRAALAFDCDIRVVSGFDRKHYGWPDLPKGYQVTQQARPLATGGRVSVPVGDDETPVRLRRIHIEEDTAAAKHRGETTFLDFDRSGVPLIEVVTEPVIDSPELAAGCFREIRDTLVAAGVTEGRMEHGHLRCDANVSVGGGPRVEIKNVNSFRFVRRAVESEIRRQRALVQAGAAVVPETRRFDRGTNETAALRALTGVVAYRYMPDPDLPDLHVSRERLEAILADLPELPLARRRQARG